MEHSTTEATGTAAHAPVWPSPRPWDRAVLWLAPVAVGAYVAGWVLAGVLRPGYDPREQAISELFELGAPWTSRGLLVGSLLLSGVAFLVLAPVLHRLLPGEGLLGPVLVVLSGVGTLAVVAVPCSAGCPGWGTSPTDTGHVLAAGGGYLALVLAPLAFAWRLRHAAPRLAGWSVVLGGVALAGLLVRYTGLAPVVPGLQQRAFNTVADAWYVVLAVVLLRRREAGARPRAGASRR